MKWTVLLLTTIFCLGCGGLIPGKTISKTRPQPQIVATQGSSEKRLFLAVLEQKYTREHKNLNLAIVRGMLFELDGRSPAGSKTLTLPDLKVLRKNPSFLSLESTVEHLSHRESVKLSAGQSAFHKP